MNFKVLSDANKDILELRNQAFVVEKKVPRNVEFDGKDNKFMHFCLYDGNDLVGCARGNRDGDALHLGRVAVKTQLRSRGYGRRLFEQIELFAANNEFSILELSAIETAVGFYEKIGFSTVGNFYNEAGWPHINMIKKILKEIT